MTYNGGIPARSTICSTVNPRGGGLDDTTNIQNAINACPTGQVVSLSAGTFTVAEGSYVLINKAVTVRGNGPTGDFSTTGTLVTRTGGAVADNPNPGAGPTPHFILGPVRYVNGFGGQTNLTADAVKGATSVTVSSTASLSVGMTVLVDELSGAAWQTDPAGRGKICASSDYQVVWQKHDQYDAGTVSATTGSPTITGSGTGWTSALNGFQIDINYVTYAISTVNSTTSITLSSNFAEATASGLVYSVGENWDDPIHCTSPVSGDAVSWFSRTDRPNAEVKQIAGISGSTVTFSTPFHFGYRTSHTGQVHWYTDTHVTGAALESVKVQNADDGQIRVQQCNSCWVKSIDNTNWLGEGFAINDSFRTEIREFYVHDAAWPQPGGAGYAISSAFGSSETLIENGISIRANKVMVFRASGAATVVAYNYVDSGFINSNANWQEIGLNASHMVGSHHVLFEGNYGFNWDSDSTHGNSTYLTVFRNHLRGVRLQFNNPHAPTQNWAGTTHYNVNDTVWNGTGDNAFLCTAAGTSAGSGGPTGFSSGIIDGGVTWTWFGVGLRKSGTFQTFDDATQTANNGPYRTAGATTYSYYMSYVGNVLGLSGQMSGWVNSGAFPGSPAIWLLGWDPIAPYPVDANVAATAWRHGNWDYLSNSVTWDASNNHVLPSSLYTNSKPGFFNDGSGYTWPWVDPTGGTKLYTLPAKARYDAGTPFAQP